MAARGTHVMDAMISIAGAVENIMYKRKEVLTLT